MFIVTRHYLLLYHCYYSYSIAVTHWLTLIFWPALRVAELLRTLFSCISREWTLCKYLFSPASIHIHCVCYLSVTTTTTCSYLSVGKHLYWVVTYLQVLEHTCQLLSIYICQWTFYHFADFELIGKWYVTGVWKLKYFCCFWYYYMLNLFSCYLSSVNEIISPRQTKHVDFIQLYSRYPV